MQSWLYRISERINALQAVLDEAEDKSIEPDIKTALAGIYEGDVPSAVSDGIRYIKRQEAQTAEISNEIKRLQALKKTRENRLARVRRGYAEFLAAVGATKIETASGNMTLIEASPETVIDSIDEIPNQYTRETIKIDADKVAIKKAIQAGEFIPGAHLESKPSIRIK